MTTHLHTFASIFRDEKSAYSLSQFSENDIHEIETTLFDKNGKAYVKCLVTGKERQAKP